MPLASALYKFNSSEFNWTADVWLPVILSLSLGVSLALYTGLVASRIFTFFQARQRALVWLFEIPAFLRGTFSSPRDLVAEFSNMSHPLILELKFLGHDRASLTTAKVMQSFIETAAAAIPVQLTAGELFGNFPTNLTAAQMDLLKMHLMRRAARGLEGDILALSKLQPNYWPLFTPHPFPNYVTFDGKLIGLMIPRKSAVEIMRLRILKWYRRFSKLVETGDILRPKNQRL